MTLDLQTEEQQLDRIEWLLRDLATQTYSLEQAALVMEGALSERRERVHARWDEQSAILRDRLISQAKDAGVGQFNSWSQLWEELQKSEPWEISPRRDLHDEWISFEHHFGQEHFGELQAEVDTYLRYGNIVAGYAVFESFLVRLCAEGLGVPAAQARKKGFDRMKNAIEKRIPTSSQLPEWAAVDVFREVRNCIAHESGDVIADRLDAWRPRMSQFEAKGILVRQGRVCISSSTLLQFTSDIHLLFARLANMVTRRQKLRLVQE